MAKQIVFKNSTVTSPTADKVASLQRAGLNVEKVEKRLSDIIGESITITETRLGFMTTELIFKITSTGKTYLMEEYDDDYVYPYPFPRFRKIKTIDLIDLKKK